MDYEKKYKEALELARDYYKANLKLNNADENLLLEDIFPELRGDEDEKIRKALVRFHKSTIDIDGIKGADILAWLEKQGEQKPAVVDFNAKDWYVSKVDGKIHDMTYNPTNKIEPKFKIGDVLCDKSCTTLNKNSQPNIKILDIMNDMYICNNCSFPISQQDEYELVTKKIEPQSAWSDEDEEMDEDLIKGCVSSEKAHHFIHTPKEVVNWLKSLKERIGG